MKTQYAQEETIKFNIDIQNPIHFLKRWIVRGYLRDLTLRKVADVGCGSGVMSRYVRAVFHGYDLHPELIDIAWKMNPGKNKKFMVKNLYDIHEKDYDVVLCTEMLEYLEDDDKGLRKMQSMLKPGGRLILTVPVNKKFATSIDKSEGFKRYTKKELFQKLEKAGFTVEKWRYWGFPLTNIFYLHVYVPSSERRKKTGKYRSGSSFMVKTLRVVKYLFLVDLLFNVPHSFDLAVRARKR